MSRGRLVGFVNVVGDGGSRGFVLDMTVHPDERQRGIGMRLVRAAGEGGC
ncbi:GNAT family N-acetyltransferase [Kitasatospora sp. NBC_00070]